MGTPRKTKSLSKNCVTPTGQKVSYHEAFKFGNDTLHRSFSFQQLWSPGLNGKQGTAFTQIAVSNYKLPLTPSQGNKRKKLTYDECSPKRAKLSPESKLTSIGLLPMFGILTATAISLAVGYYSLSCTDLPMKSGYRTELELSLFGQTAAVSKMIHAIDRASYYRRSREFGNVMMVLVGPVGVGKSYASSILKKYFPHEKNIVFVSANALSNDFLTRSMPLCWSLLAVEDCNVDNAGNVLDILADYYGASKWTYPPLVLLMITSASNNLAFERIGKYELHLVPFAPLKEDDVRNCFIKELMKHHYYRYTDDELSRLVAEQMQVIPEVGYRPGCKLVSEKVIQFLADKHIDVPYS